VAIHVTVINLDKKVRHKGKYQPLLNLGVSWPVIAAQSKGLVYLFILCGQAKEYG